VGGWVAGWVQAVVEWRHAVTPPPFLRHPNLIKPVPLCPEVCTRECLPYPKPCPGSSPTLSALGVPEVECSGNGVCSREEGCLVGDTCAVVCICNDGYAGRDCGLSAADMEAAQALRTRLVDALVCSPLLGLLRRPPASGGAAWGAASSVCVLSQRLPSQACQPCMCRCYCRPKHGTSQTRPVRLWSSNSCPPSQLLGPRSKTSSRPPPSSLR
jgi:hypothetical protein